MFRNQDVGSFDQGLDFRELLNSMDPMQLLFPPFGPLISQDMWEYRWQGCLGATLAKEHQYFVHLMEKETA